jgi:hypothetical protein
MTMPDSQPDAIIRRENDTVVPAVYIVTIVTTEAFGGSDEAEIDDD